MQVQDRDRASSSPWDGAASRWRVAAIVAAATALALALRIYQLARPGFLHGITEYDDGVYFGASVRLLDGVVAYRDFSFIQPPGIILLLSPLALLAKSIGTAAAFSVARVLTAAAGAAAVPLAGLLVRHRGAVAVTLTCGLLAVYPAGIDASHTLLLEPWLVLFCLLGALAAFDRGELTRSPRRLAWSGAAFGFATALKLWAVFPVLALALLLWRAVTPRLWLRYIAGAAITFSAAMLPFFVLAPGSMYRDVVRAQLSRTDIVRLPLWLRIQSLAGLSAVRTASHTRVLVAAIALAGFVAVCVAGASLLTRRRPPALELFAGVTAVAVLAAFLWPHDYYPHYAWFFAPFLAIVLGGPAARLAASFTSRAAASAARVWTVGVLTVAAAALAVAVGVSQFHELSRLRANEPARLVRRDTPPGACVLTDIPAVTILANRFVSSVRGCSEMVDPIGTSYALSGGRNGVTGAGRAPQVQAVWRSAFRSAQYVWIQCPPWAAVQCFTSRRVPWTRSLRHYFAEHFAPVRGQRSPNLYARRGA